EVQPDGIISASLSAQRGIRIGDGSLVDCVDPPGCVMFAIEQIEDGAQVNAPIAFNAPVPPPPAPVIELDPPGPFADHQVVQLTSSGFTPGDQVNVLQCAGAGVPPFQCRGLRFLTVPEDGTVRAGVRVQRFIEVFSDASAEDGAVTPAAAVDCAEVDACTLVVLSFNDAFGLGTTPLLIDPNAPAVPPPSLVVEPSTNLEDGQVVAVHGFGFTPGGTVYMVECRGDSSDQTGRACDLQKAQKSLNAGNDGTF